MKLSGANININGDNNRIELELPLSDLRHCKFNIRGNDNVIRIGASQKDIKLNLDLAFSCHNRRVIIGRDFSSGGTGIFLNEDNAVFECGENCMFSYGIDIRTDGHAIMDMNGNVLNTKSHICLGNRVWLGARVSLTKNVTIPDDSIVGSGSVVTKRFDKPHVVLGGNPARVIKEGIYWDRENASIYKRKISEGKRS